MDRGAYVVQPCNTIKSLINKPFLDPLYFHLREKSDLGSYGDHSEKGQILFRIEGPGLKSGSDTGYPEWGFLFVIFFNTSM